jgi:hypothetical protein
MAVSKGSGARSQRRLTARSKFRAIQAILFTGNNRSSSSSSNGGGGNAAALRSLGGYLFCLAELQELRLPSSEQTLADAVGFSLATLDETADTTASSSTSIVTPTPTPSPLVSTWLHDEGHHSDVCELARDVLLAAASSGVTSGNGSDPLTALWTSLFTCMARHGHVKALLHSLSISSARRITVLCQNPYLNSEIFKSLSRVADDAATRMDQVTELLAARHSVKEKADKNSDQATDTALPQDIATARHVLLRSNTRAVGRTQWDSPPEDVGLSAARIARCWAVLGQTHTCFALDPSVVYASAEDKVRLRGDFLAHLQHTALHLLAAAQKLQICSLPSSDSTSDGTSDSTSGSAVVSVEEGEDRALRAVLAEAAQRCALASFGVLRNLSEEVHALTLSSLQQQQEQQEQTESSAHQNYWTGIISVTGDHLVKFLENSLTISSTSRGFSFSDKSNGYGVLEALVREFPDHVVVTLLNQLCKLNGKEPYSASDALSSSLVSKSLVFDDQGEDGSDSSSSRGDGNRSDGDQVATGIAFQFIEEIIRCIACSPACSSGGTGGRRGSESFAQRGKTFTVIFNWMFNR